ncbi:hypothetical protein LCGC14_1250490 [marine sediment metagenome]|uniref:Uncharacterized protein n=1 Tax=marine sediment metagenome TaxID=412755 RepID=A0A0F9L362_9ZZZZ
MSEEWKHASWVSSLGKWAWIIVIINGIIEIIYFIVLISEIAALNASLPPSFQILIPFWNIWGVIAGVIIILIGYIIIRPKFSEKCATKDWDALYNWFLSIGDLRIPWMLIWGIILEILSLGWWVGGWGGVVILISALVLIFAGPKPYEWKVEK